MKERGWRKGRRKPRGSFKAKGNNATPRLQVSKAQSTDWTLFICRDCLSLLSSLISVLFAIVWIFPRNTVSFLIEEHMTWWFEYPREHEVQKN